MQRPHNTKVERMTGETSKPAKDWRDYSGVTHKMRRGHRIYLCELHPTKREPKRRKLVVSVRKFYKSSPLDGNQPNAWDGEHETQEVAFPVDEGLVDSLLDALILAQQYLKGYVKELV